MPITTPLTSLLGITDPILSAPMDVIAGARLTAAVSGAGGARALTLPFMFLSPLWERSTTKM